jgi:hypothetical protein
VLRNYLDNLDYNNIGNQGMILLMQSQLLLSNLYVSNYSLYSDYNNITADGPRLIPNCNWIQLKLLDLSNNIFI